MVGILGWMNTQLPDPIYFALTKVPAAEQAGAEVYLTVRTAASFEKQISDALLDVLPDQAELINDRDALRYGVGRYADDISGLGELRMETHDSLLRYLGQSSFDQTNSELQIFIGLLMLIILVSVIFVIRNSFAMSVSERISEFGLLRVAGGSPAQIRRLVMQDALHLAIFSIPLGILAGLLAMQITLSYVSGLEVAYIENLRLVVSPWPLAEIGRASCRERV